jgi:hypothetical protein
MQPSTHENEPWMIRAIESVSSQADEIKIPSLNLMYLWQRPVPAIDMSVWFDSAPFDHRYRVFELVFGKLAPAFEYVFNQRAQRPSDWQHARLGLRPFPVRASGSASFTNQGFSAIWWRGTSTSSTPLLAVRPAIPTTPKTSRRRSSSSLPARPARCPAPHFCRRGS